MRRYEDRMARHERAISPRVYAEMGAPMTTSRVEPEGKGKGGRDRPPGSYRRRLRRCLPRGDLVGVEVGDVAVGVDGVEVGVVGLVVGVGVGVGGVGVVGFGLGVVGFGVEVLSVPAPWIVPAASPM